MNKLKNLISYFAITFVVILVVNLSHLSNVKAADIDAGETIFYANCAACHAGGQNVIMPEKTGSLGIRVKTGGYIEQFPCHTRFSYKT